MQDITEHNCGAQLLTDLFGGTWGATQYYADVYTIIAA